MAKRKPPATHIAANIKHQHDQALTPDVGADQHDREMVHGACGPPRLIGKVEVIDKTSLSYPFIWRLMRAEKFPRSRVINGRVLWVEAEVDDWIKKLPMQPLKGDKGKRIGRGYFNTEHAR
jgi:predicted DNA-binding transcriptional regulator AlpA